MSGVYDNWERLVGAVLDREELRRLAFSESLSSSITADFSSRFSFDSSIPASSRRSNSFYRDVPPIEFKEIKKAIKYFQSDMLSGESGQVYGWIDEHTLTASEPGCGTAVAIKHWKKDGLQGHREWLKEIILLSLLHHPNLVKLVGYCSEENNMMLVYEFIHKGSLDSHLFRRGHRSLSWAARIKVAIGAARGLSFLHDMEIPIIHRDFKAANILLDAEFNAKLSGFGLAMAHPASDMTDVSTPIMGTFGYTAPEYLETGHLTTQCDVYGFGVVLLELLSGLRVLDYNRPREMQDLVAWAKPFLSNKRKWSQKWLRIMDTRLAGQYPRNEAYTLVKLALRCMSAWPKERPKMAEVVAALEKL